MSLTKWERLPNGKVRLIQKPIHPGKAFTKTAEGRAHGLPKIEGRNLDPAVPDLVRCACGRVVPEDMVVAYEGRWMCDGCWTDVRRRGLWDNAKVDVEPDA